MSQEVVEVIYGKHRVFRVIADRGLLSVQYHVRSTDQKVSRSFRRPDEAVHWARSQAAGR